MDIRLAVLLHTLKGLRLSALDLEYLCSEGFLALPISESLRFWPSAKARQYFESKAEWFQDSLNEFERSQRANIEWLYLGQPGYPQRLAQLSLRPVLIGVRGNVKILTSNCLSIVGSRTPNPETVHWLRRELPEVLRTRSVTIVSGGARGVDQLSHRLALFAGTPTVCVLPSGLSNPYPIGQEALWEAIVDGGGALVSTCGLSEPMRKCFFHIRNRWIAGLSPVCFVAEANRKSGSLLTAKLALEENRTLATLPCSPVASQGLGNLDLLVQGAFMLRDAQDLIALLDLHEHQI